VRKPLPTKGLRLPLRSHVIDRASDASLC